MHQQDTITKFVPATSRGGSRSKEWFDSACYKAVKATSASYKSWQHSGSEADLQAYKHNLDIRASAISAAKLAYQVRISDKISNATHSPKNWWPYVNEVLDNNYKPPIPTLEKDGQTYTSDEAKATLLNDYFVQQTDLKVPISHLEYLDKSSAEAISWEQVPTDISRVKVTQARVLSLLQDLNVSKATGSDQIPALLLKRCALGLLQPLTHLFQVSVDTGVFPSSWKIADVIALHKKGSKNDIGNYRPISLLPILSKVLETVVSEHLTKHIGALLIKTLASLVSAPGIPRSTYS